MTGKHLLAIMTALGLNCTEVAELLNYSPDAVRAWIRRGTPIPTASRRKIESLVVQTIKKQQENHHDVIKLLAELSGHLSG
jgi:predicted transcriptional regulator